MHRISRKDFLRMAALSTAAVPALSWNPRHITDRSHLTDSGEVDWNAIRHHFLQSSEVINLNNGAVGPQPIEVIEAHEELNRLSNRAPSYHMWGEVNEQREPLRNNLAQLIGAQPNEVAICRNTTEALNTFIFGMNLRKGDEVVVSDFDYPFALNAWKQRAARDGIVLRTVRLPLPISDPDQAVELFRNAIGNSTKVVHLTHVINWTGQIMPVKKIAEMAREKGCLTVVDAAHSLAQIPLSFSDIGCDFLATSLHKWLGAPFGTGAMVVRKDRIADLWPLHGAYDPRSEDIDKFEFLGTRSYPTEMAAIDAMNFHKSVGPKAVHERLHQLKMYWTDRVKDLSDLKLHTALDAAHSGGMATFSLRGYDAVELHDLMLAEGIHTGMIRWNGLEAIRISPHIYTSFDELDQLVNAIRNIPSKE